MEPLTGGRAAPFDRLAIVGVGLIGGSIARAARRCWPDRDIIGVDPSAAREAAAGVVTRWAVSVREVQDADLIVLAAPVDGVLSLLSDIADAKLPGLVTDVGSTKRVVLQRAADLRLTRFVGGHPMAGAERGGFAAARADLFTGRPWCIVPGADATAADVSTVEAFARALGAEPRRLGAAEHDRWMAYVSHVPQLLALALLNATGRAGGMEALAVRGRVFSEMTRVAASPAAVWRPIVDTNADFITEALQALRDELPVDPRTLRDRDWLDGAFNDAHAWLDRLGTRGGRS